MVLRQQPTAHMKTSGANEAMTAPELTIERIDYTVSLSERDKLLIMASVVLGLFLEALDQTIVATALPAIIVEVQGIDLLAWVSTGYLLASTALVPIYGKLSDILGRRTIIIFGIILFLIGSLKAGLLSCKSGTVAYYRTSQPAITASI